MTDAKLKSFWHRAVPATAVGVIIAAAAAAPGCGGGTTSTSTTTSSSDTTTSATTGSGMGGGSTTSSTTTGSTGGSTSSSTGTGGMHTPQPPQTAADVHSAFDATPDPDNKILYFTALGVNGPGVYSAPADGSMTTASAVYPTMPDDPNSPLISPFGIAISTNGKNLYVADPAAGTLDQGAIYVIPIGGGLPTILVGTNGTSPRGVEIGVENGADVVYFTGVQAKAGGLHGIFKIPAAGGAVTDVSVDPSYIDPSGITVAANGDLYFVDTTGSGPGTATIVKLSAGSPTPTVLIDNVQVGYPAGIALTMDDKTALVSALDSVTLTDRLLSIDLTATPPVATEIYGMELGAFTESAGLHRAKNSDSFAWADSSAGPAAGRVYSISFK